MKTGISILIIALIFILINDALLYLEIRKKESKKIYHILFGLHSLIFIVGTIAYHFTISSIKGPELYFWVGKGISVFLLFYVPKTLYIVVNAFAKLFKFIRLKIIARILSLTALLISIFSFLLIFYGISLGRYDYKVMEQEVCIAELPDGFNDFRIVQLSDLHLGSLGEHYPGISKLVREVNALKPDLIVFTGDMVNNFASELLPWKDILRQLSAPYGKYAVTGNHDYGDYSQWPDEKARQQNLHDFFRNMEMAGFTLLNNSNTPLVIEKDTVYLCGVENFGRPPFASYGNMEEAIRGTDGQYVRLLLSHDPSRWQDEMSRYPVHLTLSGHTHAMQLGITIGRWSWSPAKFFYPTYNGLYQYNNRQLYVSRGEGYIGFAGRIGQRPEITLIRLTNGCRNEKK